MRLGRTAKAMARRTGSAVPAAPVPAGPDERGEGQEHDDRDDERATGG